jgi:integrase
MPQRLLTDRFCQHAKVRDNDVQTDYFDEETPGLALRVSHQKKSWTYLYTGANGKRRRLTIGTYPATSLASIRSKVDLLRSEIEAGIDPKPLAPDTLKAICEEYVAREGKRLRTAHYREQQLNRLIYPAFGHRPINDIKRSEIVRWMDQIEDENGPVMADRTLAILRKIMNWHAARSDEFRSPIVRGMARTSSTERARDRILTDDELRSIWEATEGQGVYGALVQFILLTAARRSEAAEMKWPELDGRTWTLPAARNKTKVDLLRPLSKAALALLPAKECELVWAINGKPLNMFSLRKQALDVASGVSGWTLHDCRRTARSLMSRAGVPTDHAERCLGHVIPGVRGVYDRHEYFDEKVRAFEALAAQVQRIIEPQENVVPIGRKR